MKDNECRIIKIEKDALFEFIYENFIANHEELMDLDAVGCMNTCAHKDENEHGDIVPFPKDIDVNELLKVIPATTNSILEPGENYRDYSFDELRELQKKQVII